MDSGSRDLARRSRISRPPSSWTRALYSTHKNGSCLFQEMKITQAHFDHFRDIVKGSLSKYLEPGVPWRNQKKANLHKHMCHVQRRWSLADRYEDGWPIMVYTRYYLVNGPAARGRQTPKLSARCLSVTKEGMQECRDKPEKRMQPCIYTNGAWVDHRPLYAKLPEVPIPKQEPARDTEMLSVLNSLPTPLGHLMPVLHAIGLQDMQSMRFMAASKDMETYIYAHLMPRSLITPWELNVLLTYMVKLA